LSDGTKTPRRFPYPSLYNALTYYSDRPRLMPFLTFNMCKFIQKAQGNCFVAATFLSKHFKQNYLNFTNLQDTFLLN